MTSKQREQHIDSLLDVLKRYCTVDRWGMYHFSGKNGQYKLDPRKNNLKIYVDKVKIKSVPLTRVSPEGLEKYIQARI